VAIQAKIFSRKAALCVRLFLLFAFFSLKGHAKLISHSVEQNAFRLYLDLELDSCLLAINNSPETPFSLYLESLVETTKIFLADDENLYKAQKEKESQLLSRIESTNFAEQQKQFLLSEVKIQWSILKMKYGDEFSAFWGLRQAYHLTNANLEEHPDYIPPLKSFGFLNILFGIVPDKYHWILTLFGVEGNVSEGLKFLKQVAETENPYALEGHILIALLNTYLLNHPEKGLATIREIQAKEKGLLIKYAFSLIAIKNSESNLAMEVLKNAKHEYTQPFKLPQLYYLLGEIHLQKGELNEAIDNYLKFIHQQHGLSLIKDAYYKTGICYLMQDNAILAKNNFENVLNNGWTKNEADEYAQNQVETGSYSSKELYRLRYATDGGFYENAMKIHSSIDIGKLNGKDLCEYYYRTARLMQKTDQPTLAIDYYLKTMEAQKEKSWYFAPNAALQLGLIYEDQNNYEKAQEYLQLVFRYKNHPYQKSIRQKAKTILNDLD